jgi:acetolactate synthase I/II/III large subunit
MIKWKQRHEGYPDYGMDTGNPDFVKYAESYGAHGHRVESLDRFAPLLRKVLDAPGVHVVEVPVDYADDDRLLNDDIPKLAAAVR